METTFHQPASQDTLPGSTDFGMPDLKIELLHTVRDWAGQSSAPPATTEILSLRSATEQLRSAISDGRDIIDIPLAPHLSNLSFLRDEHRQFTEGILNLDSLRKPLLANFSLAARILGQSGLEFKVDETQLKNAGVGELLTSLRESIPGLDVSLTGKWLAGVNNIYPEFFIRLERNKISDIAHHGNNENRVKILDARYKARAALNLPSDASDEDVERERLTAIEVAKYREKFHELHKKLLEDPSALNSGTLVSGRDWQLIINEATQIFSAYILNPNRLILQALTCAIAVVPVISAFLFKVPPLIAFSVVAIGTLFACTELPKKLAKNPLNTIKSPSIRALLSEIRQLGYRPVIGRNDCLEVHTS